jgi:hypothetical protein
MSAARFGLCPNCKGSDGFLNVGPYHWFVCDQHIARWNMTNRVLDWEDEDMATWEANVELLDKYTEVQPAFKRKMAVYPIWRHGEV